MYPAIRAGSPAGGYEEWGIKRTLYAWLGIAEYWIYDPTRVPVRWQGYRLERPGVYQALEAMTDPPGAVLDTVLKVSADHALQLWDAARGTWFDSHAITLARGHAEELAQGRIDGFLQALPDTGLPPSLQKALGAYMERVRHHALVLPPDTIPDAGTLWQLLYRYGGPAQVPTDAPWALMPSLPDDPSA